MRQFSVNLPEGSGTSIIFVYFVFCMIFIIYNMCKKNVTWRYSCSGLGELGGRPVYMMPLQQGDSGDTSPYTSPKHRE